MSIGRPKSPIFMCSGPVDLTAFVNVAGTQSINLHTSWRATALECSRHSNGHGY